MTFKNEVTDLILTKALYLAINSDQFDQDSLERAMDLGEELVEEIELEDPENDSAIHNVVSETLRIYSDQRMSEDDGAVPGAEQADLVLFLVLVDLLNERNAQIRLNDILGG